MTSCYDQLTLSADHYHVTISRTQVYSSLRSRVLLKLTADQVLVFDWIASSCQVNLLKTEPGCSMVVRKPVNSNPGLKVNQIITVSSIQMFFVYSLSRSRVFLKLTADQVLVFDWIAGSCQGSGRIVLTIVH